MRKGQILVENAVVFQFFMLMVVAMFAIALMTEMYGVAQLSTIAICELYAETPNISGAWGAEVVNHIPLLGQNFVIPSPRMDVNVGGNQMLYDNNSRSVILVPLSQSALPSRITCQTTYRIFAARLPLLGPVDITGRAYYTTNRRYGSVMTDYSPPRPVTPPLILMVAPALLGCVAAMRPKNTRGEKGQALPEYAIIVMTLMIPVMICAWSIATSVDAARITALGGLTLASAALGPNPARVDVSFSWGGNSCTFAVGENMDCNSGSPYSATREFPGIPTISFGGTFVSMVIGGVR